MVLEVPLPTGEVAPPLAPTNLAPEFGSLACYQHFHKTLNLFSSKLNSSTTSNRCYAFHYPHHPLHRPRHGTRWRLWLGSGRQRSCTRMNSNIVLTSGDCAYWKDGNGNIGHGWITRLPAGPVAPTPSRRASTPMRKAAATTAMRLARRIWAVMAAPAELTALALLPVALLLATKRLLLA
ncbi:hypothetical protein B0H67DRAFT_613026 [Lasiosphaeris hirsuta]|uniref:Uncharacterized protein n=1 Tax=Lasiosphaeris hirsuta TaxID=260670 RepID=A0AA40DLK0_9PEZI|nr:hypothetical protein B0H67DRAFT_613026 [Lasiosphaeris hirsuta]